MYFISRNCVLVEIGVCLSSGENVMELILIMLLVGLMCISVSVLIV